MPLSARQGEILDRPERADGEGDSPIAESLVFGRSPVALASIIESRIIPELLLAHRSDGRQTVEQRRDRIAPSQTDGFAPMVLRLEAHALMEQVEGFLARGASPEAILIDLLAPAARQLGVWWEEDACDFVDVTMGLWRLQQVVHELSARFPGKATNGESTRRALFSVCPGGQHSFGTVVIDECFRRQGWLTTCLTSATQPQLMRLVSEQSFDLLGLTISCDAEAERAASLIAMLRTESRNPALGVMVGGRVLAKTPELALEMGADATAADAEIAVSKADVLLEMLDGRFVNRC